MRCTNSRNRLWLHNRCGFDKGIVLESDSSRLRHGRKLLNQALHQKKITRWTETLEYHTHFLVRSLAQDPARFMRHIRQYVSLSFPGIFD